MKVTTRPSTPTRRRREPDLSHRLYDIAGIALLALALLTVVSLLLADSGIFGQMIETVFRSLFGKGAWIVPFVFAGIGVALIAGRRKLEASHLSLGVFLVF